MRNLVKLVGQKKRKDCENKRINYKRKTTTTYLYVRFKACGIVLGSSFIKYVRIPSID